MKILVTGFNGQLGFDVAKELNFRHIECMGVDMADFDVTDFESTQNYIFEYSPDAVIHCAAYTAVDKAEDDIETCYAVNVNGSKNIASACEAIGAKIIYVSTDYVFGGYGSIPFQTDDAKAPLNEYGKTKLLGEQAVSENCSRAFIVRTSWVFGENGNNFVKTMLRLGAEKESINVVHDQIGSPTYTKDLAVLLCDMVVTEKFGIYHATNEGFCSWADFAKKIMEISGLGATINFIPTSEYKVRAARPLNSRLSKKSLDDSAFNHLPSWEDALKRYLCINPL